MKALELIEKSDYSKITAITLWSRGFGSLLSSNNTQSVPFLEFWLYKLICWETKVCLLKTGIGLDIPQAVAYIRFWGFSAIFNLVLVPPPDVSLLILVPIVRFVQSEKWTMQMMNLCFSDARWAPVQGGLADHPDYFSTRAVWRTMLGHGSRIQSFASWEDNRERLISRGNIILAGTSIPSTLASTVSPEADALFDEHPSADGGGSHASPTSSSTKSSENQARS